LVSYNIRFNRKETDASFLSKIALTRKEAVSKGETTRQRIVADAAPIFNQRGYAGCSMRDVMDATGLEKGGIYRHFASKEELAAEAFKFALANAVKLRTGDLQHVEGSVEKLRYLVNRFAETPSSMPGGCPLMNTAIDSDDGNAVLRALAREGIQNWQSRLIAIIEAGVTHGEIKRDTDPRRIANTIIATLEGALMITRIEGSRRALQDAQAALNGILDQIAAAPRRRTRRSTRRSPGAPSQPHAASPSPR
jgi:TetR/AcrR family transcriptional regulator, transcriptional repressor for nem operon